MLKFGGFLFLHQGALSFDAQAKQLQHCLRSAETFPDSNIVSTLWRQLTWPHFIYPIQGFLENNVREPGKLHMGLSWMHSRGLRNGKRSEIYAYINRI